MGVNKCAVPPVAFSGVGSITFVLQAESTEKNRMMSSHNKDVGYLLIRLCVCADDKTPPQPAITCRMVVHLYFMTHKRETRAESV